MRKGKIFKVICEYYIKANTLDIAEEYVKEEAGIDFYERHLIVDEIANKKQEVDIDLT